MLELFQKGGWVMYAIGGASVLAATLIIERLLFFARIHNDDVSLIRRVEKALVSAGAVEAMAACGKDRGPVQGVVVASLQEWDRGCERMEDAVNFEGSRAVDTMGKHLTGLSIVAQSAPLLGLLGTVVGMIETFMVIEQLGGEVNVPLLAGGIWKALLTTAFGLTVAIPALFAYHYFEAKVNRYANLIRDTGERLVALRRTGGKS